MLESTTSSNNSARIRHTHTHLATRSSLMAVTTCAQIRFTTQRRSDQWARISASEGREWMSVCFFSPVRFCSAHRQRHPPAQGTTELMRTRYAEFRQTHMPTQGQRQPAAASGDDDWLSCVGTAMRHGANAPHRTNAAAAATSCLCKGDARLLQESWEEAPIT